MCPGCGGPVPESLGRKPRKWCSEACRVRAFERNHPDYIARSIEAQKARSRERTIARAANLTCDECGVTFTAPRMRLRCSKRCDMRAYGRRCRMDGRIADASARRRAREKGAKVKDGRRSAILMRDGWVCQLCGTATRHDVEYPHPMYAVVDHVVPLARGGIHAPSNWQTAHTFCNGMKSDLMLSEFHRKYPDIRELLMARAETAVA
jgi:hypothetical protein